MLSLVRTRAFRNTNNMLSDKTPEPHRSYSVEHILSLESFHTGNPIAVSTNGQWLAITVHSHRRRRVGSDEFLPSGFPSLLEGGEIWIVDVESGKRQNITPNWGTSWGPSWAPDRKQLSFFSDKDRIAQLWV
jgi:Tol biopolymer transport system component